MVDLSKYPPEVAADMQRMADEIGKDYRTALRKAFDLPPKDEEPKDDNRGD